MGDLLCAMPVIRSELDRGVAVHLLLFPNPVLVELCSLVELGAQSANLHLHAIPRGLREIQRFVAGLRVLSPSFIWISPHAPAMDSSWRVPLFLRIMQVLYWKTAKLVGVSTERFSRLFDIQIDVDRTLPLSLREWAAYLGFRSDLSLSPAPPRPKFIASVQILCGLRPVYDLLIQPGAGAKNRVWHADKYPILLSALPPHWKVGFFALPKDLVTLKAILPSARHRICIPITESLRNSLEVLASARLLLVMNSGTMHFAEVLGIPGVALFGQQNPEHVIEKGWIVPIYKQTVACQPCARAVCDQPQIYCLSNIDPSVVAQRLVACSRLQPPTRSEIGHSLLTQITADGL